MTRMRARSACDAIRLGAAWLVRVCLTSFGIWTVAVCGAVLPGEPANAATARDHWLPETSVTITASSVAAALRAGRSFDRAAVRITGRLDLRALRVVSSAFRCRSCHIDRAILAPDVTFRDVVDLSGTTVTGPVDFRGATFDRVLAWRNGKVGGAARFRFAVFQDAVAFDNSTFASTGDFSGVSFRAAANFAFANFNKTVSFTGATFSGKANFTGRPPTRHKVPAAYGCQTVGFGAFAAAAVFTNATFAGTADFRGRCFAGPAEFSDILVDGTAVFDGAEFAGLADFERGVFEADVSFRGALFRGDAGCKRAKRPPAPPPPACSKFTDVNALHDLVFDYAQFGGTTDLTDATIAGTLSFLFVCRGSVLFVDSLSTGELVLPMENIGWLPTTAVGDKIKILQQVEITARSRGQTDIANNARFMWLDLSRQTHHDPLANVADLVFYRLIAGYLVKPLSPLRALLVVVALATIVRAIAAVTHRSRASVLTRRIPAIPRRRILTARTARTGRRPPPGQPRRMTRYRRPGAASLARPPGRQVPPGRKIARFIGALPRALQDTLAVVVPRLPKNNIADHADRGYLALKVAEWITVKALLVLTLLCVANANATLHQFIEAILNR